MAIDSEAGAECPVFLRFIHDLLGEPDDLVTGDMPPPHNFPPEEQCNAKPFLPSMVYEEIWQWLHERSVDHLIPPQHMETYAVTVTR